MTNQVQFLYINGDSWTTPVYLNSYTDSSNANFKNVFVINKSLPWADNISIINRTKSDLEILKRANIHPAVCISLTESGKTMNEFKSVKPKPDLNEWLADIQKSQIEKLKEMLVDYNYYITTGWTANSSGSKRLIDFIGADFPHDTTYAVSDWIYDMLVDYQHIFKFTSESLNTTKKNRDAWRDSLEGNDYVKRNDGGLHLRLSSSEKPYTEWLSHVIDHLGLETK